MTVPAAGDLAISAVDLRVRRGAGWRDRSGQEVLHGVTFDVPRGTVTGLLGPSGCGKTTLMRAVVGAQRGVTGSLCVLGRPAGESDLRVLVGYATQTASVYDDLTVDENLRYFATLGSGAPGPAAVQRRTENVIARVGLIGEARRLVATLSGGQRSRVSLAAAILGGPELLVLDEPTVGLDPVLRRELWQEFHTLAASGTSLLVSSHVMDEANRCDRLLLLRDGKLIADDTPAGLLAATDTADLDQAFLYLVDANATATSRPGVDTATTATTATAETPKTSMDNAKTPAETAETRVVRPRPAPCPRASRPPTRVRLTPTGSTTLRVIRQLRRDRRTVALVLLLPPALLWLLQAIFADNQAAFDRAGAGLLGVFPLMTMFFLTSVAMLRERRSGTLERLLTTPIGRIDLLAGYGIGFGLLAVLQAAATTGTAVGLLDLHIAGPVSMLLLVAVLSSLFGTALGLLTSAFAHSEFQAVQFLPPVLLPQFLLSGILVPRAQMNPVLETISAMLPMTYVVDALTRMSASPQIDSFIIRDTMVIAVCVLVALVLAAATLRRRSS